MSKLSSEDVTQIAESIRSKVDITHAANSLGMFRDALYKLGKKHPEIQESLDYINKPAKNRMTLNLPDDTYEGLQSMADELNVTTAALARMLIREGVQRYR